MLLGASVLVIGLFGGSLVSDFLHLLPLWFVLGVGYSLTQTPSGRLLRRSAHAQDRPSLFAAQFALSHCCWLITYPLAGWAGKAIGLPATFAVMGSGAASALWIAFRVWPVDDPQVRDHVHDNLVSDDPHIVGAVGVQNGYRHMHEFIIDAKHPSWPHPP